LITARFFKYALPSSSEKPSLCFCNGFDYARDLEWTPEVKNMLPTTGGERSPASLARSPNPKAVIGFGAGGGTGGGS